MNKNTYIFHSDPSHAWLAVKRSELKRLGIMDKISGCSYQKGNTVYLEEDCDATLFFQSKERLNETFEIKESKNKSSYCNSSPIRSYEKFS